MGLEAATYIGQLVETNPTSTDFKKEGDNHLRMIKAALKATFPNANRAYNLAEWAEKNAGSVINTADYSMLAADNGKIVYFDCSGGARVYNLLASASAPTGAVVFVDRDNTVANALTIDGSGTEKINGSETIVLRAGESGILYKTGVAGAEWRFLYSESQRQRLIALSVLLAAAGDAAVFESNVASAARGPDVVAYRNRNGVNNDILGSFVLRGKNTAGTVKDLARWRAKWIDVAAASEDAQSIFSTLINNVEVDALTIGAGLFLGAATGGDKGIGTLNATGLYIAGAEIKNFTLQRFAQASAAQQALASRVIPADNTTPLVSEGSQAFSQAITPKATNSLINIRGVLNIGNSSGSQSPVAALFRDSTCIAVFPADNVSSANDQIAYEFEEVSGSLTARTYSVRYGADLGNTGLNVHGGSGANYNGLVTSTMIVEERVP